MTGVVNRFRLPAALVVVLLGTAAPAAAPAGPEECVAIADSGKRLGCYDRVHGRGASDAAATSAPSAEAASPQGPASELGAEQLPKQPEAATDREGELITTVADMGRQMTGRHWFRLENGQLWSQVSPGRTTVQAGDSVRISRGRLGTYSLRQADGESRSTAVRRLE